MLYKCIQMHTTRLACDARILHVFPLIFQWSAEHQRGAGEENSAPSRAIVSEATKTPKCKKCPFHAGFCDSGNARSADSTGLTLIVASGPMKSALLAFPEDRKSTRLNSSH